MLDFRDEVDGNFLHFYESLPTEIDKTIKGLAAFEEKFQASYRRLISLQAWRSELLEKISPHGAEAFFKEAQNDALMSHSLARQGAWRVALMSLRSCIENALYGLYYMDHPVELVQWGKGSFKLGFSETITYLTKHPALENVGDADSGIERLKAEYAILSKAVHGSAQSFRVTKSGEIQGLNIVSLVDLGSWETRERFTLAALNKLFLVMFKGHLQGAANTNLRKAVSLAVPEKKHAFIREKFNIRLYPIPEAAE